MELVIGDKTYSSWSMRPWLVLKHAGKPFVETRVKLRQATTQAEIAPHSPSGWVPVLNDGDAVVWDSLAICEYLAERFPEDRLWPADVAARAAARSVCAEMHSGFQSLRGECPMDLRLTTVAELSEATRVNIRRIVKMWTDERARYGAGGPYLFGAWSIADAFYTPVATRFRSYGVRLSDYGDQGAAGAYCEALLETAEFMEWEQGALEESEVGG